MRRRRVHRAGLSVRAFVFYNSFNPVGLPRSRSAGLQTHFETFVGDVRDLLGGAPIKQHFQHVARYDYNVNVIFDRFVQTRRTVTEADSR